MSKSKRAAQGMTSPAPQKKALRLSGGADGMGTGWLLAVSLAACAATALLIRIGLARAFSALFGAWGIDATNAACAPGWARALFAWHGSLITLISAAALWAVSRWLRRLWLGRRPGIPFDGRALSRSALAGLGFALLVAALCLLPDSLRLEWPLGAPRLSLAGCALLAISLAATLAEEYFTKGALYDGLQARHGRPWATAAACAVSLIMDGGLAAGLPGAVNVLLLGLALCLIHARHGLWAAVGFRWGWSAVNMFLLGFGGGDYAVYRLYGVSEALLTGGDRGPVYGLWTTLGLAGLIGFLIWKGRRADPPSEN